MHTSRCTVIHAGTAPPEVSDDGRCSFGRALCRWGENPSPKRQTRGVACPVSRAQGLINMRECKAEDVDVDGLPKSASRSKYDLDGGGGSVSLLIRVSHKARRPAALSRSPNHRAHGTSVELCPR